MAKLLGIDLWTTNTFIAVIGSGKPAGLGNSEGTHRMPSVAAFIRAGEGKADMNRAKGALDRLKIAAGIVLVTAVTGCVGYVGGGYGGAVVLPVPDLYFYGGGYERGHEVHAYSRRGFESRGVAHGAWGGRR